MNAAPDGHTSALPPAAIAATMALDQGAIEFSASFDKTPTLTALCRLLARMNQASLSRR